MKSKSLTICSHCFCPPGLDLYAQHLKWQIASLILNPPPVRTTLVVCHGHRSDDAATWDMLHDIWETVRPTELAPNLILQSLVLTPSLLLRRAIGRNMIAKNCKDDICWWIDADYFLGPGCIQSLCEEVYPEDELCYPTEVQQNHDHATGDKMVEDARGMLLPAIDPSLFSPRKRDLAIGGLQIVGGNLARRIGYLDGTKWVEPIKDVERGWHQTSEDKAFRKGLKVRAIDLPKLYWIRHVAKGANVDLRGKPIET